MSNFEQSTQSVLTQVFKGILNDTTITQIRIEVVNSNNKVVSSLEKDVTTTCDKLQFITEDYIGFIDNELRDGAHSECTITVKVKNQ
jgi:hypothetical protein